MRHHRSEAPPELVTKLGCSIEFGADADEIVFATSAASLPSVGADIYLNRLLLSYADEAVGKPRPHRSDVRSRAEDLIIQLLPHGRANADVVAGRLGMSRRTLARALSAEGVTFSELVDSLRTSLAKRYLSEQELPVSQVAWLLGYREASSFTKAFIRWTGSTPRRFRAVHGRPGSDAAAAQ
jgi:AraC-like DNA-binding protein